MMTLADFLTVLVRTRPMIAVTRVERVWSYPCDSCDFLNLLNFDEGSVASLTLASVQLGRSQRKKRQLVILDLSAQTWCRLTKSSAAFSDHERLCTHVIDT
jgi:hypothetical protein